MASVLNRQKGFGLLFHLAAVSLLLAGYSPMGQAQEVTVQRPVSGDALVVADVGDQRVYAEDFRKRFLEFHKTLADAKQQGLEQRKLFLEEQFIEPYLKLQCAYDKGYDKLPAYESIVNRATSRQARYELYNQQVINKVITTQVKMERYNQIKEQLEAEHIQGIPSFEEMQEEITEELTRKMKEQIDQREAEYLAQLYDEMEVVFHTQALDDFLLRAHRSRLSEEAPPVEDTPVVLVSYRGGEIDTEDLRRALPRKAVSFSLGPEDRDVVNQYLKKTVREKLYEDRAKESGIFQLPVVKESVRRISEAFLINSIERDEVWRKISITKDQIEQYHRENEEEFATPGVATIREYYVNELDEAQRIYDRLEAIEDPNERYEAFRELSKDRYREGQRNIVDHTGGDVGEAAFKMQIGEIKGPMPFEKSYIIFQLLEIKPPKQNPLERVISLVENKLREQEAEPATERWLTALRQQYPVKIYEDALMRAF